MRGTEQTTRGATVTSTGRTTEEVLRDHLDLRSKGELESDIERNYHEELVLLHSNGVEHGHSGIRKSGHRLQDQLPGSHYEVTSLQVHREYGYLEWRARSEEYEVVDGADSFVVKDGKIVFQSIHYTLRPRSQGHG